MKKLLCLLLVMLMSISFVACSKDDAPKTETKEKTSEETESKSNETLEKCPEDKNGIHNWRAANCEEPATCWACDMRKDDNLGNHSWDAANCTRPTACSYCGEYKDDKLGSHQWEKNDDGVRECSYCGMLYEDYAATLQNQNQ